MGDSEGRPYTDMAEMAAPSQIPGREQMSQ